MLKNNDLFSNERRRLHREKRLGPARGKRPPIMENQQSSLTEPRIKKHEPLLYTVHAGVV
ncbi:MAG: hypothetical protein ACE3JN_16895 [Ectobacillus sp.]